LLLLAATQAEPTTPELLCCDSTSRNIPRKIKLCPEFTMTAPRKHEKKYALPCNVVSRPWDNMSAQTFAVSSYCRWDWWTSPLVFATKAKCGHKESWSNAARTAERGDTGAGLGLELLEEVADIGMLLEAHLELIQIYRTALWRVQHDDKTSKW
jgi:hypothetical protein